MKHRAILGTNIRRFRKHRDLSQEALAQKCGLDRTYVGGIERGERNVSIDNIGKIADALDVPIFQLLQESDAP